MSNKRHRVDESQISWTFLDPEQVLRDEAERGDVVFEAPDASKIVANRPPRLPRVRQRRNRLGASGTEEPASRGLPFGTRVDEGRVMCWSCARTIAEGDVVRPAPGVEFCPGCGARLPFV
jgi:hypothetical protein